MKGRRQDSGMLRHPGDETLGCWDSGVMNLCGGEPPEYLPTKIFSVPYCLITLMSHHPTLSYVNIDSRVMRLRSFVTMGCWETRLLRLLCAETLRVWNSLVLKLQGAETLGCWDYEVLTLQGAETMSAETQECWDSGELRLRGAETLWCWD